MFVVIFIIYKLTEAAFGNETSAYSATDIRPGSPGVLLHEEDHHSQREAELNTLILDKKTSIFLAFT